MNARLPNLPAPWHHPPATDSPVRVEVTHVTDPLCPWAYSAEPTMRALQARYGDQLVWRTVLIGLVESVDESLARGSSAEGRALTALRFRRLGMPITPHVRPRVIASAPACRLIIAAQRQDAERADALLRLMRLAWFTTDLLLDEDQALLAVATAAGLDGARALADAHGDEVAAEYATQRAEARTADRRAVMLRRTARSDGPERHTAPTLLFHARDGRTAVVPGFQPFEAADVALMNLEPRLVRLPPPTDIAAALRGWPGGLTSQEAARILADTTTVPDRVAAETQLTQAAAAGAVQRRAIGDDALWTAADFNHNPTSRS